MNLRFDKAFEHDLEALTDERLLARIERLLDAIRAARTLAEVPNVKMLEGWRGHFRIRMGDYRLGCRLEAGDVVAVRFLHRREIYRRFPATR